VELSRYESVRGIAVLRSTVRHQQCPPLAVSITSPPYGGFGRAVDVDRMRPCDLCPGAIFGLELRRPSWDLEPLECGLRCLRQRHPAVPVVLRLGRTLDGETAHLIQVAAQLHVRGVVVDGDPICDTLRRFLTEPVDLATDVVEWLSLRRPTMPPQLADLIRKIFLYGPTKAAVQKLFGDVGESTRTARARCRKLALPPPSSWLQAARAVHAALRLQRKQSTPLLELAMELGYSDHSALSHQLLRVFGTPASAIRRMLGWEWLLDSWLARWSVRAAVHS
jgi:AraC-like DNA-binding protein